MNWKCRQFLLAIMLIAVVPTLLLGEESSSSIDPSLVIEQFDVFNDGDMLLVPVNVLGKDRMFFLDTGCPGICFDRRLRPLLGEPQRTVTIPAFNDVATAELFKTPPVAFMGSLQLGTTIGVACVDLSHFRRAGGHDVDGIIGMDFLRYCVIHIDFDAGKILFLGSSPSPQAGDIALPIRWVNNIMPGVEVAIADHGSETFVIDTGFVGHCMASINAGLMKKLEEEGVAKGSQSASNIDLSGKAADVTVQSVKKLSVAEFEFNNALVTSHKCHCANVLGLDLLSRFNVTLDFRKGVIYLKKSKRFNEPTRPSLLGVDLERRDGRIVVRSVVPNSPASKAGIRPDDEILRVGDHETKKLRLFEIKDLFCLPAMLHLDLQRGQEMIGIDLQLRGRAVLTESERFRR